MLNNLKRRALTLLLSLAMIITYMPTSMIAYAVDGDEDQVQVEQQVDADKPAEEAAEEAAAPKVEKPEEATAPEEAKSEAAASEEAPKPEKKSSEEAATPASDDTKADVQAEAEDEVKEEFSKGELKDSNDRYEVVVSYGADAEVPKGAKLVLTEFEEKDKEFKEAKEALVADELGNSPFSQATEEEQKGLGMAALDLTIYDKDGNVVEPKSGVKVGFKVKVLPDGVDANTLADTMEIQHLNESSGDVVVEKVATVDSEEASQVKEMGEISVNEKSETAEVEFLVDAFSNYTISWGQRSYTIHYVDTNGNSVTPTMTPTFTNGNNYLIYDVEGYDYDSAHLSSVSGTAITPMLRYSGGEKQYRNGANSDWVNLRNDIYIVYKPKTAPTQGGTAVIDDDEEWPEGDDAPQFSKSSLNNVDGTNTISLDIVGGEKPVEASTPADVIVIFDVSGSMRRNMSGSQSYGNANTRADEIDENARLSLAATATKNMAKTLLANNNVRIALISFSNTASQVQGFTNSYSTIESRVNALTADGGTNWEEALKLANHMDVRSDAATFVVFVTDGDPTFRVSRGNVSDSDLSSNDISNSYYRTYKVFGEGNSDNGGRNLSFAVDQVSAIAGAKKNFYAIGISTEVTKVQNLTTQGGVAADHAFIASDETAMHNAFSSITESIKSTLGFGDVDITDGITELTHSEMKVYHRVDPDSFQYYRWGGEDNKYGPDEEHKTEWTTREADGCAPASYDEDSNTVNWNMGEGFQLESGVHYVVTFKVWPSQDAYDLVANLNNGVKVYEAGKPNSITPEEREQVVEMKAPTATEPGSYALKTNTETINATYSQTSTSGGKVTVSGETGLSANYHEGTIQNMVLPSKVMTVRKAFDHSINAQDPFTSIIFYLKEDGKYYMDDGTTFDELENTETGAKAVEKPVNTDNEWKNEIYIAPGFMEGEEVLETGHKYSLEEKVITGSEYEYEFTPQTVRPMIIDGVLTYLVLVDKYNAPGKNGVPASAKTYTIDGEQYYVTSQSDGELVGTNRKTAELDITKVVDGRNSSKTAEELAEESFTYRVTLQIPDGTDPAGIVGYEYVYRPQQDNAYYLYGYHQYEGGTPAATAFADDIARLGNNKYRAWNTLVYRDLVEWENVDGKIVSKKDADGNVIWKVPASGGYHTITYDMTLKQNEVIRFTNLPTGTKYTIQEIYANKYPADNVGGDTSGRAPVEDPSNIADEGYTISKVQKTAGEVSQTAVQNDTVSGTIEDLNIRYYNQFTNTLSAADAEINVTKAIEGYEWADGDEEYKFTITPVDGAPSPENADITISGAADANHTVSSGRIRFTEAGTYSYKVKETAGGNDAIIYDGSEKTITFTVTNTGGKLSVTPSSADAEFTNKWAKTSKSVEKRWADLGDLVKLGITSVEVTLKNVTENKDVATYNLVAGEDWKHTFNDLPKYTAQGVEIVYQIVETAINGTIDGQSVDVKDLFTDSTQEDSTGTTVITNTRDKGKLIILKELGEESEEVTIPAGTTFVITGPADYNNGTGTKTITYADFTSGKYEEADVPTGTYSVTETDGTGNVTGYTLTVTYPTQSGALAKDGELTLEIENTYVRDKGKLIILKELGEDSEQVTIPAGTTFVITGPADYNNGTGTKTITYADFTSGKYEEANVPTGTYSVTETDGTGTVTGYTLTVTYPTQSGALAKDGELTLEIENTYTRDLGGLKIIKRLGEGSEQVTIPAGTTFVITGPADYNNGTGTKTITYADFTNGQFTEADVPTGTYSVTETDGTGNVTGYTLTVTYPTQSGTLNDGATLELIIENTYVRDLGKLIILKELGEDSEQVTIPAGTTFVITGPADYNNGTGTKTITYADFTSGKYEEADVPTGTYSVTETDGTGNVTGYTLTVTYPTQSGALAKDGELTLEIENTYTRDLGGLKIIKRLGEGSEQVTIPAGTTFVITGPADYNNGTGTKTITYADFTSGKYEEADVPTGTYRVTETDGTGNVTGYTLTVTYPTQSGTLNDGATLELIIENTYVRDLGKLIILKELGDESEEVTIPAGTTFVITGPADYNNGTGTKTITYADFTSGKYEEADVPTGTYSVTETDGTGNVTNYTLTVTYPTQSGALAKNGELTLEIENTYTRDLGKLIILKELGEESEEVTIPAGTTFVITGPADYNNGTGTKTITYADFTSGKYEEADVPTGTYSVTETDGTGNVTGYTLTVTYPTQSGTLAKNGELTLEIENTYNNTSYTVTKIWEDNSNQDGKRPASIQVQLKQNGSNYGAPVTVGLDENGDPLEGTTVSEDGNSWSYTWSPLETKVGDADAIYTVEELTDLSPEYTTVVNGNTIINTHEPEETKVNVVKTWADSNDQDGKRANVGATMQLYKIIGDTRTPVRQSVNVGTADDWSNLWEKLPVYENGTKLKYVVIETLPDGSEYTKSADPEPKDAVKGDTGTFEYTNSYTPEETRATVVKVWDDANNQDGKRPPTLKVTLTGNGDEVDTVTLSDENKWTATIDKLPVYANGTKISYVWTEEKLPEGYTLTNTAVVPELDDKQVEIGTITTFTNSYTPELTEAHVTKVWNDNNNKDEIRPNNVYVQLYADGEEFGNLIALNEANNWHHDWSNLDKFKGGKLIEYTVDEVPVPEGYTKEITQVVGQTNAYIVTNSHQSGPEKDVFSASSTTSIDGKVVQPGDELTYTIEFVNVNPTANDKTKKVVITDDVPDYTTYVPDSATSTVDGEDSVKGAVSGKRITWTFENEDGYDSNTTFVATFKVTVDEDKEPVIENTGHVRIGENTLDTNTVYNSKPVKDVFEQGKTTTSIDGKAVKAGDKLTYKVNYTNVSNDVVKEVSIEDSIPAHTKYIAGSAAGTASDGTACVVVDSGDPMTWTFTAADTEKGFAKGTEFEITFDVEVLDDAGEVIENDATVLEGENEHKTNIVKNTKPHKDVYTQGDTTTSIDGKAVKAGDKLTYKVNYTNTSKDVVKEVSVEDSIPEHTKYIAGSAKGTASDGTACVVVDSGDPMTWTFTAADPTVGFAQGTTFEVTFDVEVLDDAGDVVENEATVLEGGNKHNTNIVKNTKPHKDVFTQGSTTSIDGKVVKAGDKLTYKVNYINTSNDVVKEVSVEDSIPAHTKYIAGSAAGTASDGTACVVVDSGDPLTWTFTAADQTAGFAKGTEFEITFDVEVLDDAGEVIENEATVLEGENEHKTNIVKNTKPHKDVFTQGSTTSIDGKVVKPGDKLTYKVNYTNTSKDVVKEVSVEDSIPEHTKYIAGSAAGTASDGTACVVVDSGDPMTWTFTAADQTAGFAQGTTFEITFDVEVLDDAGEVIENEATVLEGKNEHKTNIVKNSKPHKDVFEQGKTTTSIDGKVVKAGDKLTYKVNYTNTSNDIVKEVSVEDSIPAHTKYIAGSAKGTASDGTACVVVDSGDPMTWTFTAADQTVGFAKGTEFEITFDVEVLDDAGEVIENEATVLEGENEHKTNIVKNTKPHKDVFTQGSTTSIDGKAVKAGDKLTYKVSYTNTSKDVVKEVSVEDSIPEHTKYIAGSAKGTASDGTACVVVDSGDPMTWTFTAADPDAGFAQGTTFEITFDVEVLDDAGDVVENEATVLEGENEHKTNIVKNSKPHKDVFEQGKTTTSIDGKVVKPGDKLTYKVNYVNTSKDVVKEVSITDSIPAHTKYIAGSAEGKASDGTACTIDDSSDPMTWTFTADTDDGYAQGTEFEITFDVEVLDDAGYVIENEATVLEGENEHKTNIVKNSKPHKDVFTQGSTTTSIDGKTVKAGDKLTYKVNYANTSKDVVKEVKIEDSIPAHTKYIAGSAKGTASDGTKCVVVDSGDPMTWTFTAANAEVGFAQGTEFEITFDVEVLEDDGTLIENQAKVNDGKNTYDTNVVKNSKPLKDVFRPGKLDISINDKEVKPGENIVYGITFENATGEDTTATVTDKLPDLTTFVEATDGGTNSGGTVTWTVPMKKDEVKTVYVTVKVSKDVVGEILENTAVVKSSKDESGVETNTVHNPTPFKLVISKDLTDYVDNGEFVQATFVFEVTGKYVDEDGVTKDYYNTIGLDFQKKSDVNQTAIVTGIPSTISGLTVTESYAGNYTADEATIEAKIQESGDYANLYLVEFNNTKKNHEYKGGVVNNYAKNENGEYKYKSPGTNE